MAMGEIWFLHFLIALEWLWWWLLLFYYYFIIIITYIKYITVSIDCCTVAHVVLQESTWPKSDRLSWCIAAAAKYSGSRGFPWFSMVFQGFPERIGSGCGSYLIYMVVWNNMIHIWIWWLIIMFEQYVIHHLIYLVVNMKYIFVNMMFHSCVE
jgi:hypothetical protein